MYRIKRTRKADDEMSLDSLMDVLSCSVGVMLFIVIIAVIEARGTNILLYSPPLLRDPPGGTSRILVLCLGGKVRVLEIDKALEQLIGNTEQLSYSEVPGFVEKANRKNVTDGSFQYGLVYRDEAYGEDNRKRVVSVRVEARAGTDGDGANELGDGWSEYERVLSGLDEEQNWLAFGVDTDSLEVFRKARSIALERGFSTGWDPVSIEFPYEEVILGGGFRQLIEGKPRSGLGIIQ